MTLRVVDEDYEPEVEILDPDGDEVEESEEDNDFADLEALLAHATAATAAEKRLKEARRRLAKVSRSGHDSSNEEGKRLLAEIRELEMGRVWVTEEAVALFYRQTCTMCQSAHVWFEGWMTGQKHATDPNSYRMIKGKPVEALPERTQYHESTCEVCYNCVETIIAVDMATQPKETL
jgi:hypothetical protein